MIKSTGRAGRRFGVVFLALAFLGVLLLDTRQSRASGNFLETMGISIAVGTVLGASTLPFYTSPGSHLINLAYGASAGAVVGLGIWVYGLTEGPLENGFYDASLEPSGQSGPWASLYQSSRDPRKRRSDFRLETGPKIAWNDYAVPRSFSPRPAQFWMPVVSLNW